jgi:5-methylcytosine-specific restriction endonuclease McrA
VRKCSGCGEEKTLDMFSRDATKPLGRRYECLPCGAQRQRERYSAQQPARRAYHRQRYQANPEPVRTNSREWYRSHREYKRDFNYRRAYGLTAEQVDVLVVLQERRCKLCGAEVPLVVDHDHGSGVVRGMLCHRCNLLLGQIEKVGMDRVTSYLDSAAKISNAQGKK